MLVAATMTASCRYGLARQQVLCATRPASPRERPTPRNLPPKPHASPFPRQMLLYKPHILEDAFRVLDALLRRVHRIEEVLFGVGNFYSLSSYVRQIRLEFLSRSEEIVFCCFFGATHNLADHLEAKALIMPQFKYKPLCFV